MCGALIPGVSADVVVLKFGSSLLEGPAGFRVAASEVMDQLRLGRRVVAVCSARRGVTAALAGAADEVGGPGSRPALVARLLATGESASVALLALAVAAEGVGVHAMEASDMGLRTRGSLLDAEPVDVDVVTLRRRLREQPVVVVPGFVGVDDACEPSLLGRGGSDLTAVFLAHRLGAAECRLVKDVDGLFTADPHRAPEARRFAEATWDDALHCGGGLVQEKALVFARERGLRFRIVAPRGLGTLVGPVTAAG